MWCDIHSHPPRLNRSTKIVIIFHSSARKSFNLLQNKITTNWLIERKKKIIVPYKYASSTFSYRLELMRQIYNIESPPPRPDDSSPNTTPTGNDGPSKSLFKCPLTSMLEPKLAFDQRSNGGPFIANDSTQTQSMAGAQSGDLLKCLATCANASRLSLANLLPSRSDWFSPLLF